MIRKSHSDYPESESGRNKMLNLALKNMLCVCVCGGGGVDWIHLAQDTVYSRAIVETVMDLHSRLRIF